MSIQGTRLGLVGGCLGAAVLLAAVSPCVAEGVTASVRDDGRLRVLQGTQGLLTVEMNAHALDWVNVSQRRASVEEQETGEAAVRLFTGRLAIPGEQGGELGFEENVRAAGSRVMVKYDVHALDAMTLCGLQVSANLEVEAYKGAEVLIEGRQVPKAPAGLRPGAVDLKPRVEYVDAEPLTLTLPVEADEEEWQLFDGRCDKITVRRGTGQDLVISVPEKARFVIQDNRQWGHELFEIRLVFVMAVEGQALSTGDSYTGELTLDFGEAVGFLTRR